MTKSVLIINLADSLSMAVKLAKSGYQVGLIGRNLEKLKRQQESLLRKGIIGFFVVADPANESQLRAAITALESTLGKADLLIYRPVTLGPTQTKVRQQKKPIKSTASFEGSPCIQPMSIICGFGANGKDRCMAFGF